MKINKELKNIKLEILDHEFTYSQSENPIIKFKLKIIDEIYDPIYTSLSLTDETINLTLSKIRYMTGLVIESIFDIYPDDPSSKNIKGKIFIASIVNKPYKGNPSFVVQFPDTKKKITIEDLKILDNKYKKDIIKYASMHKDVESKSKNNENEIEKIINI